MQVQFTGDGADFPMLGEKVVANLHTGFETDHLNSPRLGIVGKGLTRRPVRPQTLQHRHIPDRFSGQRGSSAVLERSGVSVTVASTFPRSDDAGKAIEMEP
jgi:hypothetical protein